MRWGAWRAHVRDGVEELESVTALPASPQPSAISSVNVAVRDGEVLILGLTNETLSISLQTAERLAQRLLDAVTVARGQIPGRAQV